MNILGIETSCDETAVCLVKATGEVGSPSFELLSNALYSQVKIHEQYGGVFPTLAKREHSKNLIPLFEKVLGDAGKLKHSSTPPNLGGVSAAGGRGGTDYLDSLKKILEREPELLESFLKFIPTIEKPDIDAIAVTAGPGLEPALWVGINFALALGKYWNIPVMPTNHMEGHIMSVLGKGKLEFPALALLISGGHTELVLMKNFLEYEVIGNTRDDAVGEAFDKVARILGLPYPGGPEISKLAAEWRSTTSPPLRQLAETDSPPPKLGGEARRTGVVLPRPMLKSDDFDFSFSGLKTAVLYAVKKIPDLTPEIKKQIAAEFENAVADVLVAKTKKALEKFDIKTLILGGGVTANTFIKEAFRKLISENFSDVQLFVPDISLSTDNAVMIAMAGYLNIISGKKPATEIKAQGNLNL